MKAYEVADFAGVNRETLRRHVRAGAPKPPKTARGLERWLARYATWREARVRPEGRGDRRTVGEREWSRRALQALALTRLFDLQVKRALYVRRELVDDQRERQVRALREALTEIANRVAPVLFQAASPEWVVDRLLSEVHAMCEHFANAEDDQEQGQDDRGVCHDGEAINEGAGDAG